MTTMTDTPIYTSVLTDLKWHPDMLRAPFDLDAVVAASYARSRPCLPSAERTPTPARTAGRGRVNSTARKASVPVKKGKQR